MRLIPFLIAFLCAPLLLAETPARVRENFNAGWLFQRQSHGTGELGSFDRTNGPAARVEARFQNAAKPGYDDSSWDPVDLPHTWNAQDAANDKPGYWRGIGWYRKHFRIDRPVARKRVFLEFEGANAVSEFWLNGAYLGRHAGGYTGFEFDITPHLLAGADNVLTAKVDNLFHDTIPPTVKTDYTFYGGIYRDVWLRITDPVYAAAVDWTTPSVTLAAASVKLSLKVTNTLPQATQLQALHEILDPNGRLVTSVTAPVSIAADATQSVTATCEIKQPLLWSPDSPNLYRIRTALRDGRTTVDIVENPLGIRWFKFDPQKGLFLNGERVQIQGTNWHQFYPGMGSALPHSRHRKDMEMIREMGVNFWRTSHYPHDPVTLEASDRLGLMVWEELPVNKEIGDPDEYVANVSNMAKEMIARDRNHPSIVLWGIAGEVNAPKDVSIKVVEAVARLYRALDSTRPVVMHSPRGDEIEALVDVVGIGVDKETDEKHARYPARNYMVGEYAAALSGRGIYGMGPDSEELACDRHEKYLAELNRRPWMAGGCIWHQFDFEGETYDTVIPHVNAFGMADSWRIPKDVYYFYQSQWTTKPMVHIVGHWTWPGEESKLRDVKVYSNAPQVELFLNGKSLGTKNREDHQDLKNPPRVWQVVYEPGTLKAVAQSGAAEVTDSRATAGPPYQIVLQSDEAKLLAGDRESLAYLTATVADKNGNVVPSAFHPISFGLYGPGELLEQTWPGYPTGLTWNAIAGKTRVAFRSTQRSGRAVISAYSPGLKMGRVEVDISAPGKPNEMDYKEFGK
jgi:beta-galactosidase